MTSYIAQVAYLVINLVLAKASFAVPQVAFPLNSQVPPVAYASRQFQFSFSAATFIGNVSELSYTLRDQPKWLSLDGQTRSLSGTPSRADVGTSTFGLVAWDKGEMSLSGVTLVVLEDRTLYPSGEDILTQLSTGGYVSNPAILLLHHQRNFEFSLKPNLFDGVSLETIYYATSSDGSPLPSWISFDPKGVRFQGTTPPSLVPDTWVQTFAFNLVASNVPGFSEATLQFQIQVCSRILAFVQSSLTFLIVQGSSLYIPSLLRMIYNDGSPTERKELVLVDVNAPPWLNLNASDLSLTGIVPADAQSSNFSIIIQGVKTNTARATIFLHLSNNQKTSQVDLGTISVFENSYLAYSVTVPAALTDTDTTVMAKDLPDWLTFNTVNQTLQGSIPDNLVVRSIPIQFFFGNATYSLAATLTLFVNERVPSPHANATTTNGGPAISNGVDNTQPLSSQLPAHGKQLAILLLAIILPVLAVVLFILAIITWMKKRKRHRERSSSSPVSQYITPPVIQVSEPVSRDLSSGIISVHPCRSALQPAVTGVPQLELPWPPDSLRQTRNRLSKRPKTPRTSVVGSSWDDLIDFRVRSQDVLPAVLVAGHSNQERTNGALPVRPSHLQSSYESYTRTSRQTVQRQSRNIRVSRTSRSENKAAGAVSKRLSGAGHGAGWLQAGKQQNDRTSWQTTLGTIPVLDGRPGTIVLDAFPAPPSLGSITAAVSMKNNSPQHQAKIRPTLRLVESNSTTSQELRHTPDNEYTGSSKVSYSLSSAGTNSFDKALCEPQDISNRAFPYVIPEHSLSEPEDLPSQRLRVPNRSSSRIDSQQFDSAVSSESQWEDEGIINSEEAMNHTYDPRQPLHISNIDTPSHAPARHCGRSEFAIASDQVRSTSSGTQLAHQQRYIEIQNSTWDSSQKSQKGSIRFI